MVASFSQLPLAAIPTTRAVGVARITRRCFPAMDPVARADDLFW